MKTPQKRRPLISKKQLYKPQLDPVDFSLEEPEISDIQKDVNNILQQLTDGDDTPPIMGPAQQVNTNVRKRIYRVAAL